MGKANNQQQNNQKGEKNQMKPELHVLTKEIKEVKTVGSNENDVAIAETVVNGLVKKREIDAKVDEIKLKYMQDYESRKLELEAKNKMVGKIIDGVKSVTRTLTIGGIAVTGLILMSQSGSDINNDY